jgi:hypothetical protein
MYRTTLLTLALTGCTIENTFGDGPPEWPFSIAPPIPGVTQTDAILQVTTPEVDILWMVDNSCSMSNEQTDLTENFPSFMDYFLGSGLDYHVGVVSSDIIEDHNGSQGKLVTIGGVKFIEPNSPSPVELFVQMASLGINGTYPEKGLGATYLALEEKRDTTNAGFYRDTAALHTIIISDEPDFTDANLITQPEYVDWYDSLKPSSQMRTFSAIIDSNRGIDYSNTARAIGGIVWDLNDENWPQLLERLGLQAAGLKREYFLSDRPVIGTIVVTVEDVGGAVLDFTEAIVDPTTGLFTDVTGDGVPDGDWTYDAARNSITFVEYVPNSLSTVLMEYELLAAANGSD